MHAITHDSVRLAFVSCVCAQPWPAPLPLLPLPALPSASPGCCWLAGCALGSVSWRPPHPLPLLDLHLPPAPPPPDPSLQFLPKSKDEIAEQIVGGRQQMADCIGISAGEMMGARAPFLEIKPEVWEVLSENGFLYDRCVRGVAWSWCVCGGGCGWVSGCVRTCVVAAHLHAQPFLNLPPSPLPPSPPLQLPHREHQGQEHLKRHGRPRVALGPGRGLPPELRPVSGSAGSGSGSGSSDAARLSWLAGFGFGAAQRQAARLASPSVPRPDVATAHAWRVA